MTALTTQDVGTGYLLVGIVVGLVGAGWRANASRRKETVR